MKVKGQNVLYFPYASIEEFKAEGAGGFNGIPFLGPWAKRLERAGLLPAVSCQLITLSSRREHIGYMDTET